MRQSKEVAFCKQFLSILGREEKIRFLDASNLNNKEITIISYRFIEGLSIKEACEKTSLEADSFNKAQNKALRKLYVWISRKTEISKLSGELQKCCAIMKG